MSVAGRRSRPARGPLIRLRVFTLHGLHGLHGSFVAKTCFSEQLTKTRLPERRPSLLITAQASFVNFVLVVVAPDKRGRPGRAIIHDAIAVVVLPRSGGDCFRAVGDYAASLK